MNNGPLGNDTICSLSTPNGVGAIALIRISGPNTLKIVSSRFSKDLSLKDSHTVHFGTFISSADTLIDEVLVTVFREGKSFTGEESAEISCHASPYIQQQIIQSLLEVGCRLAKPGEFTMRAFMNGKLDLSQAEAVADLIASQSKIAHDIALKQLRGGFSSELQKLREQLIHFASLVELELDFAEEDVEFADRTELKKLVNDVIHYLKRLASTFDLGNAVKNGVPVAIVGAPNTGKSTLLNQLLGEERAIVSDIPGTTRDVIEETLNIEGIIFRLIDTAGIRETAEAIESMGIERSREKINHSRIVLCMADLTDEENTKDVRQWAKDLNMFYPDKKILVVGNKADLVGKAQHHDEEDLIQISAKTGFGIEDLHRALVETIKSDVNIENDTIISNVRHYEALCKTVDSLEKARVGLDTNVTGDFIAMDIRQAMYDLGTITGGIATDDLLGNIFSKFCIGK